MESFLKAFQRASAPGVALVVSLVLFSFAVGPKPARHRFPVHALTDSAMLAHAARYLPGGTAASTRTFCRLAGSTRRSRRPARANSANRMIARRTIVEARPARDSRPDAATIEALDLLGRRWSLRVLWELGGGPLRFTEVQSRCDGMSPSVLNQRLGELVDAGVVRTRTDRRYELTPEGAELATTIRPVDAWARRWVKRNGRRRA